MADFDIDDIERTLLCNADIPCERSTMGGVWNDIKALELVAEVRRLRAALEAALIPAAYIDKDDQAGDAVVQILLAAVREQDRG